MEVQRFSPVRLLEIACRRIARDHGTRGADLADLTLVVPDLHAAAAVARSLQAAFGQPVVLLPRIVTLRSWTADIALDRDVMPLAAQESMLYRLLCERGWLAGADLWPLAGELAALFAELTRWQVRLPSSASDFKAQLDAAYRAKAGASFGFEARLIHVLWHASQSGAAIDGESAYLLRLEHLARQVRHPIYVIDATLTQAEDAFLGRCAARVPVIRFVADPSVEPTPKEQVLAYAWPDPARVDLPARARELEQKLAASPLEAGLRFFAAAHAEQHAQAVDVSIRQWLAAGRRTIAVVVLDRVAARRARALLERAAVLVRDEAGWALSTTSAATVIGRWLDALASDYAHGDCLDLLKSPFIFHDVPRDVRQQAVWRLEQAIRSANARSGIARYMRLAERDNDGELRQLLARVGRAERMVGRSRAKTIRGWLGALGSSLDELGVRAGLAADAAGVELLDLLELSGAELEADTLRLGYAEFRNWLGRRIEAATFRDRSIESPVIFTTLEATRLRAFDAVLLLGADANHLPAPEHARAFFNQGVRRELGLPVRADALRETEQRLSALIASSGEVLVTWERMINGEENLLSPMLERLRALHALAWDASLEDSTLAPIVAEPASPPAALGSLRPTTQPAPRIPARLVPAAVSASAYNTLMACPYRFFARHALGLSEADEVQEELDKADYGIRIHAVLHAFHAAHPRVTALDVAQAERLLAERSERAFADLIEHDYQAAGWLARWLALVPGYIRWQRNRETEGWRFLDGELDRSITIETPAGRALQLRGRIDRVDRGVDGRCAVVDYKTRARDPLRKALEPPGEDVQLPVYGLLWGAELAQALYLSIDRDGVVEVPMREDVNALARDASERLAAIYDAIADGAAMPAHGADDVCRYCELQGVCRKSYWRE